LFFGRREPLLAIEVSQKSDGRDVRPEACFGAGRREVVLAGRAEVS
jgi:hypothetical protein